MKLLIRNLLYRVTPDDEIVSPDFEPTERTVIKVDYSRILHDSPPDKFLREYAVWDIDKIEKMNDKNSQNEKDTIQRDLETH